MDISQFLKPSVYAPDPAKEAKAIGHTPETDRRHTRKSRSTQSKRTRRTREDRESLQQEALGRARGSLSMANYVPVIVEFSRRGIPENEIIPRENVLTYNAWRALGRQVRRGEKGVQIQTWIPIEGKETKKDGTTEERERLRPRMAYVFHVSQTDPIQAK